MWEMIYFYLRTGLLALVRTAFIKTDTTTPTDLTITTGSQKTLVLATPVYDDIIIQGANLRASGTTPPTFDVFQDSIYGVKFTNAQTDIVYGSFEIPHSYKEGTDLEVHLHWSPSSADTGDAFLHSIGVHYQQDTLGSRQISAK